MPFGAFPDQTLTKRVQAALLTKQLSLEVSGNQPGVSDGADDDGRGVSDADGYRESPDAVGREQGSRVAAGLEQPPAAVRVLAVAGVEDELFAGHLPMALSCLIQRGAFFLALMAA